MFRSLVGLWVVTLSGVCPPADMVARIFLLISLPVVCARLLLPWPISVGKIFLSQLSACKWRVGTWARTRNKKKVCSSSSFAPRPDVVQFFRVIMNGQLFFLVSCCINVACAVTCADELGFPFWLKIRIKKKRASSFWALQHKPHVGIIVCISSSSIFDRFSISFGRPSPDGRLTTCLLD